MRVTTAFKHIPSYVLVAINAVGVSTATLESAYATVSEAFAAGDITVADGKTCLHMALSAHLPSKYGDDYIRAGDMIVVGGVKRVATADDAGVVRDSALSRKVNRDWSMHIDVHAASTAAPKKIRVAREAQDAIDALIETYGAKTVREALKRAVAR
jgi:hypothetical protein